MSGPVFVLIGGERIDVPPIMNFATLKRAWPAIKAFPASDGVDQCSCAIRVISAALLKTRPELVPDEIENRLLVRLGDDETDERRILFRAYASLMEASGLIARETAPGEAAPAETPAGTETPTPSSPS